MSFKLTTAQMLSQTKTETRRDGWDKLKPGEIVMACVKCMGLKKGERVQKIGPIRILSNHKEPLNKITKAGCVREGFPDMKPAEFVAMYVKHMGGPEGKLVNVVRFEFVKPGEELSTAQSEKRQ